AGKLALLVDVSFTPEPHRHLLEESTGLDHVAGRLSLEDVFRSSWPFSTPLSIRSLQPSFRESSVFPYGSDLARLPTCRRRRAKGGQTAWVASSISIATSDELSRISISRAPIHSLFRERCPSTTALVEQRLSASG